jgi:hypothetical protein
MTLTAKNISNDFWVVQFNGKKIGNINVRPTGVELTKGAQVELFEHLEDISNKYPIEFVAVAPAPINTTNQVLEYPTKTPAHNCEFDVPHQLPLYTLEPDSRSKFCAGYYIVNIHQQKWKKVWCPKFITLKRNAYYGPFKTAHEQQHCWSQIVSTSI